MKHFRVWLVIGVLVILYFGARFLYFKPKYAAGVPAPAFTAVLSDGRTIKLQELRGNYVLIDFWGSWCGPCIKDKPVLKALYQKYHSARFNNASGFEIVSIAVEESAQRWEAALARYSPIWPYQILDEVSNLRFFDGELTRQFGVKRLPASFLLDPEGKIIEANLEWELVDRILAAQLESGRE